LLGAALHELCPAAPFGLKNALVLVTLNAMIELAEEWSKKITRVLKLLKPNPDYCRLSVSVNKTKKI